jgi:hypothetical protein
VSVRVAARGGTATGGRAPAPPRPHENGRPSWLYRARLVLRAAAWDLAALRAYGAGAPLKYQLLYVDPKAVALRLDFPDCAGGRRDAVAAFKHGGPAVRRGDWDLHTRPLDEAGSINARVRRRIVEGLDWEAVGETRRMRRVLRAALAPEAEREAGLAARLRALDALIDHVRAGGEILPRRALARLRFRELGGVEVAIDRRGRFLRLGDGNHRLAIAQHCGLPRVPVCLVAVHEACVTSGTFAAIRAESDRLRRLPPRRPIPGA